MSHPRRWAGGLSRRGGAVTGAGRAVPPPQPCLVGRGVLPEDGGDKPPWCRQPRYPHCWALGRSWCAPLSSSSPACPRALLLQTQLGLGLGQSLPASVFPVRNRDLARKSRGQKPGYPCTARAACGTPLTNQPSSSKQPHYKGLNSSPGQKAPKPARKQSTLQERSEFNRNGAYQASAWLWMSPASPVRPPSPAARAPAPALPGGAREDSAGTRLQSCCHSKLLPVPGAAGVITSTAETI